MKKLLPLILLSLWMMESSANPFGLTKLSAAFNGPSSVELMRMNVYENNSDGSSLWVDGAVTQYGDYSDGIDGDDGRKMTNPGANVCVLRDNINLVVERRQIIGDADTIFFKMWGLQKRTYEMRFIAVNLNHPGLRAYLQDDYLHSSTPVLLNDTTHINIDINNDPGSYATDRFRLIYETEPTAPVVHFTALSAFADQGQILLNWVTENQNNANRYHIERSTDGSRFIDIATVDPGDFAGGHYQWTDHFPVNEYNYYRIRSFDSNGTSSVSDIVNVKTSFKPVQQITVFPNPASVTNFNLNMVNQPDGNYQVRIFNSSGNLLIQQSFNKAAGVSSVKLPISRTLLPGIYHVEIIKPTSERDLINVLF